MTSPIPLVPTLFTLIGRQVQHPLCQPETPISPQPNFFYIGTVYKSEKLISLELRLDIESLPSLPVDNGIDDDIFHTRITLKQL